MKFEEMKVAELKEESRKRGLTLESKGKKFTKKELIDRLNEYEKANESKDKNESGQDSFPVNGEMVTKVLKKAVNKILSGNGEEENKRFLTSSELLPMIKKRYGGGRPDWVYEQAVKSGNYVAYVRNFETKSGLQVECLATAKIIAVNKKKRLVRCVRAGVETIELSFDEMLFVHVPSDRIFPSLIRQCLKAQVNEREERIRARRCTHDERH